MVRPPSRYQFTASGVYQLPWGVNLGANLAAREGFSAPYFETVESADPSLPEKRVLLVDPDEHGLPGVMSLDVRVEKVFAFGGRHLAFDLDIFNVANRSAVRLRR